MNNRRLLSRQGSALVMALVFGTMATVSLYYLGTRLGQQRKLTSRKADTSMYSALLRGFSDYMRTALNESWVLDMNTGSRMDVQINSIEQFADGNAFPGNIERILLTEFVLTDPEAGLNVQMKRPPEDLSMLMGTRAEPFVLELTMEEVRRHPLTHPLRAMAALLPDEMGVEALRWRVYRLNGWEDKSKEALHYPRSPRGATFVRIEFELLGPGMLGRTVLKASEATVVYAPRELVSYALLLPGDLKLASSSGFGVQTAVLPSGRRSSRSPGIEFLSPVFVNRDLYLPRQQEGLPSVVFHEPVTLGKGRVKAQEGNIDQERLIASGLYRGSQTDGFCDAGLHALFGLPGYCRPLRPRVLPPKSAACHRLSNYVSDVYRFVQEAADADPITPIRALNIMNVNGRYADLITQRNIPETCGNPEFDPPLQDGGWWSEKRRWEQCKADPFMPPASCRDRPYRVINYCDPVRRLQDYVQIQALRAILAAGNFGSFWGPPPRYTLDTAFLDNFKDDKICDVETNQFADDPDFATFGSDFLKEVRAVWNIGRLPFNSRWNTSSETSLESAVFDNTNSPGPLPVAGELREWPIRSILKDCIVRSSAEVVTGFFVCETFTIEPRSTPLRIVGTVAAGKLVIDPSAVAYGVQWSSIFHPSSEEVLRNRSGMLSKSAHCNQLADPALAVRLPLWHPFPSVDDLGAKAHCLPGSIKPAFPSPVTWGQFDPICGPGEGTRIQCSFRDLRHNSFSVSFKETR